MMNNNSECLIAEFKSMNEADVGLKVLETADFTQQNVSLVTRSSESEVSDVGTLKEVSPDAPPTGESIGVGGAIGGSVGAVLGATTLIGPFMVAGPLLGLAVGAGAAGVLSSTERWGVDKSVAADYETRIDQGNVLIIVTDSRVRLDEAQRLLKTTGPMSMERFQRTS